MSGFIKTLRGQGILCDKRDHTFLKGLPEDSCHQRRLEKMKCGMF